MNKKLSNKILIISLSIILLIAIAGAAFFILKSNAVDKNQLTLDECKQIINDANRVIDELVLQKTGEVIGKIDNTDILELKGSYNKYSDLKQKLSQYYINENDIYNDLIRRGVYVLGEKLGIYKATEISPFVTNENSEYTVTSDSGSIKTIQVKTIFNDIEIISSYTVEKMDKGTSIKITRFDTANNYDLYYLINKVEASSTEDGSSAQNASDTNRYTAWIEGDKTESAEGWIKFSFKEPVEISSISVSNGYAQTRTMYVNHNRLKRVTMEFSDGTTISRPFADLTLFAQTITLPEKVKTDYVKININTVYNGKIDKNCIAEVTFKGKTVEKK